MRYPPVFKNGNWKSAINGGLWLPESNSTTQGFTNSKLPSLMILQVPLHLPPVLKLWPWWPCSKIKTLTSLYKTFKYSTYETTHVPEKLTDQAMIQCWFCGIPEPNVCVWNSGEVYHGLRCNKCGTLWKNQCQRARNHGKNRGFWKWPLSPRWHYFKDGLPWFMSQDHHHGLKIWHFQMSQPSQPVPLVLKHRNAPGHHRSPMSCRCRGSMRSIISTGHFSKASTEDFSVGNLQRLGFLRIS